MPVAEDLLAILRCPRTRAPVRPLGPAELAALNGLAAQGGLFHADGGPVADPLADGLITLAGDLACLVDDGLPAMLPGPAIPVPAGLLARPAPPPEGG